MQWIVVLFILSASLNTWATGRAYLDIEEGQLVSLFSKPGMNWKTCQEDKNCEAVGWPDRSARIEIVEGPVIRKVTDLHTGKVSEEQFYKVRFEYDRKNSNGETIVQGGLKNPKAVGWVDAAYVSRTKKKSFYGSSSEPVSGETCDTADKSSLKSTEDALAPLTQAIANKGVTETAAQVKSLIGACVIDPKKPPAKYKAGNPYDNYVLPKITAQKLPRILKENGKAMTQKDLIDIDALARTLYAEMASCYKHGLQYPMTVAKIAVNRAQAQSRRKEFIRDQHSSQKSTLAKVVTSPTQFSLWLKKINGKPNNSLKQALCPPTSGKQAFWTGNRPSQAELDIWENTVRIATEAVLFPQRFQSRTSQVKQFHYTSGMKGFYGMKQVFPWIGDHKVAKNACVQVWDDKLKG